MIEVRITIGRWYQIRVQTAHVGHPSVRDGVYSASETALPIATCAGGISFIVFLFLRFVLPLVRHLLFMLLFLTSDLVIFLIIFIPVSVEAG